MLKHLNPMARWTIARSYFAGTKPKDLAMEWGTTSANVIMIAKRHERRQLERAARMRQPEPIRFYEIIRPAKKRKIWALTSAMGRELGIVAIEKLSLGCVVSLPYIEFIDGERG